MRFSPTRAGSGSGLARRAAGLGLLLAASAAALPVGSWAPAPKADGPAPHIVFTCRFPGSQPEYYRIVIASNGQAIYQSRPTARQPLRSVRFQAAPATVARIFAWTAQLHDFRHPRLESRRKVGFLGAKELEFVQGNRRFSQQYNFTRSAPARRLTGFMQGLATSGEYVLRLRQKMRYDPLGMLHSLDLLRKAWRDHSLSSPEILRPLLRQIEADPAMMAIVRRRARQLLRAFARHR